MKQVLRYALVLVLWSAAIVLWSAGGFPWLCWFLLVLHFIELLVVGFQTGRQYGVDPIKSIILCMLFGFVWWLPLRRKIRSETFTDADFIESRNG